MLTIAALPSRATATDNLDACMLTWANGLMLTPRRRRVKMDRVAGHAAFCQSLSGPFSFGAVCATPIPRSAHVNIWFDSWWLYLGLRAKKRREKRICTSLFSEIAMFCRNAPPFSSSDCLNAQRDAFCSQDGMPTHVLCIYVYGLCIWATGFGCLDLEMYSFQRPQFLFSGQM